MYEFQSFSIKAMSDLQHCSITDSTFIFTDNIYSVMSMWSLDVLYSCHDSKYLTSYLKITCVKSQFLVINHFSSIPILFTNKSACVSFMFVFYSIVLGIQGGGV